MAKRLNRLEGLAKDVESSWQGYLITHDRNYLDIGDHARRLIPYESRSLVVLVADNAEQSAACKELGALIADECDRTSALLSLAESGNFAGAEQAARAFGRVSLTLAIRAQASAISSAEERLLAERRRAYADQVDAEDRLMTALVAIDFLLIGGTTLLFLHLSAPGGKPRPRQSMPNTRTEQSEARGEIAAENSNLQYQRLFEAAPDGILVLDAESGQVVDANPFMKNLLGYSQEELMGRKLWEIGPFKGILASKLTFAELQKSDQMRYENLISGDEGRPQGRGGVHQQHLPGSRPKIRAVQHARPHPAPQVGGAAHLAQHLHREPQRRRHGDGGRPHQRARPPDRLCQPSVRGPITGYSSRETLGRNARFLQGEKTDRHVLAEVRESLARHLPIRRQVVNYGKDGHEYWLEMDIVPVFDAAHVCTHFAAIGRDITEEKRKAS